MIKKGTVSIVDRYKGSQLIEKVYKGSDLIFDAFSEITGSLPLSFNSRAQHALKNYRIFGTAAGAGIQTINLLDINATDASNGYVPNAYLNSANNAIESGNYSVSEYIPVNNNTRYTYCGPRKNGPSLCFYDSSKQFLSALLYTYTRPRIFTTPSGAAYVRISFYYNTDMLLLGEYDETPGFESYGYKIPLSISDGTNASNYDLFIGSTQLGATEYIDFGEQKVYKDISGVLTPVDPPAPLPAIIAYKGENTLDSTETVGDVTVKGRISEISPTP